MCKVQHKKLCFPWANTTVCGRSFSLSESLHVRVCCWIISDADPGFLTREPVPSRRLLRTTFHTFYPQPRPNFHFLTGMGEGRRKGQRQRRIMQRHSHWSKRLKKDTLPREEWFSNWGDQTPNWNKEQTFLCAFSLKTDFGLWFATRNVPRSGKKTRNSCEVETKANLWRCWVPDERYVCVPSSSLVHPHPRHSVIHSYKSKHRSTCNTVFSPSFTSVI